MERYNSKWRIYKAQEIKRHLMFVCEGTQDYESSVHLRSQSITTSFNYSLPKLLWIHTNDDILKCSWKKEIKSHFPEPGSPDVHMNKTSLEKKSLLTVTLDSGSTWSVFLKLFFCFFVFQSENTVWQNCDTIWRNVSLHFIFQSINYYRLMKVTIVFSINEGKHSDELVLLKWD